MGKGTIPSGAPHVIFGEELVTASVPSAIDAGVGWEQPWQSPLHEHVSVLERLHVVSLLWESIRM